MARSLKARTNAIYQNGRQHDVSSSLGSGHFEPCLVVTRLVLAGDTSARRSFRCYADLRARYITTLVNTTHGFEGLWASPSARRSRTIDSSGQNRHARWHHGIASLDKTAHSCDVGSRNNHEHSLLDPARRSGVHTYRTLCNEMQYEDHSAEIWIGWYDHQVRRLSNHALISFTLDLFIAFAAVSPVQPRFIRSWLLTRHQLASFGQTIAVSIESTHALGQHFSDLTSNQKTIYQKVRYLCTSYRPKSPH
jgi:hypothetical protein